MNADVLLAIRPVETEADWAAARAIRQQVFVDEQGCPPQLEWDEHDRPAARGRACHHLLGFVDGEPVATARWRAVDVGGWAAAKMERFAVLAPWRGSGYGRALVAHALADARTSGQARFVLHAQAHLRPFYEAFGFQVVGAPFEEAGIEHVKMTLADSAPEAAPVS